MKTWIITGVSSGLGRSLAEYVISQNDFVIATLRKPEQVAAFNAEFKGKAVAYELDLTDGIALKRVADTIKANHKQIDVVVNNAGAGFIGAIEEASDDEWRSIFEINFFAVIRFTNQFLPVLRKQRSGHIIQISSHGGIKAFAGFGIYNASKFALEGASEALAQELEPLGIHVTLVEPGPFRTQFAGNNLPEAQLQLEDYAQTAGQFRQKLKSVHEKQEGDPAKAAIEIYQLIGEEKPPLRLPLGKVPLTTIQMKLDSVKQDLEKGREAAIRSVFVD